ncbi:MAG: hypothetical protein LBU76_03180 [Azoarcus sp.]|nr:hypothetical protein [Azoarcus sp.]
MRGSKCRCSTQQATRYSVSHSFCVAVEHGNTPFYDFMGAGGGGRAERTEAVPPPPAPTRGEVLGVSQWTAKTSDF